MAGEITFGKGELTVLAVTPDPVLLAALRRSPAIAATFSVLAGWDTYPSANALEIRLRQIEPHFVLVDVSTDLAAGCDLMRTLASRTPAVLSVAVHREQNTEAVVGALRAGACEFLSMPFDESASSEALARLHRLKPTSDTAVKTGTIVVFTTAKPGAGSSTLATHVAHAIRRDQSKRVLLIDLDLEAGTAGFYLKLPPAGSVRDLLSEAAPNAADWARAVHDSQGLHVLAAPELPQGAALTPEQLSRLLAQAAARYEWVIVDAPNVFQPASLMAISESHAACLVTTPDLASLHLTRRAATLLAQLGLDKDRYSIVVNRMSRRDGIGQQDVERMFQSSVLAVVPNEYFSLHRAISLGQPLGGDGELGRAISQLARKLTQEDEPTRPVKKTTAGAAKESR
jgi:pilus assembly protein CpaE